MVTHRVARAASGLVAVVAVLLLTALPASANTVDLELTSGELHLYQLFGGTPFLTVDFATTGGGGGGGGGGTSCETAANGVTFSGGPSSGSIAGSIETVAVTELPAGSGDWFLVAIEIAITGSWTAPDQISGSLSATADIYSVDGPEDCEPDAEDDPCVVTAGNVAFAGETTTASALPTLATGDTAEIDGANADFESTVTGPPESCGVLISLDNGHVELADVVLTVA